MNKESFERYHRWQKRLDKKIQTQPYPVQILQRRTLSTAQVVVDGIEAIPFDRLSMNLYFYCQDAQMNKFTRGYESMVELASIDPEKFAFSLHRFYNEQSLRIRKEDLYDEFFELYYHCMRKSLNPSDNLDKAVLEAYTNLVIQQVEYLRPDKFVLTRRLCGRKTTGELMTIADTLPQFDIPSHEYTVMIDRGLTPNLVELYRKYGMAVNSIEDIEALAQIDRFAGSICTTLMPMINEYTFDILSEDTFHARDYPLTLMASCMDPTELKEKLSHRKRTLPSNGAVFTFGPNPFPERLLLKEILYNDSVYMLFRLDTVSDGVISGLYDTRGKFLYNPLELGAGNMISGAVKAISVLVLFCYASVVTEAYRLDDLPKTVYCNGDGINAKCFLQGGKQRNVYDGQTEPDFKREDMEAEIRPIQGFIRKLPAGQRASAEAVEYALKLGYELECNETFVRPFMKQVFKLKERSTSQGAE